MPFQVCDDVTCEADDCLTRRKGAERRNQQSQVVLGLTVCSLGARLDPGAELVWFGTAPWLSPPKSSSQTVLVMKHSALTLLTLKINVLMSSSIH